MVDPTLPNQTPNQRGGRRPGSGRKPGSKVITIDKLKAELDAKFGQKFESVIAEMAVTLFTDFQSGKNIGDAIRFMQALMKYVIEQPTQQIAVAPISKEELPDSAIDARVAELLNKITFKQDAKEANNS